MGSEDFTLRRPRPSKIPPSTKRSPCGRRSASSPSAGRPARSRSCIASSSMSAVDQRAAFPAGAQFLHAAAGAGSDATCDLCRLVAARQAWADSPPASCSCCPAPSSCSCSPCLCRSSAMCRWSRRLFFGVKAAVLAIVIEALLRVARRALRKPSHWIIAAAGLSGTLSSSPCPFPLVILPQRSSGYAPARTASKHASPTRRHPVPLAQHVAHRGVWLALWLVPLALLVLWLWSRPCLDRHRPSSSPSSPWLPLAAPIRCSPTWRRLRSRLIGWLSAGEMIDGLGLAETTPGPLILVTEFVGYHRGLSPCAASRSSAWPAGAAVTLWMTFVPCFLWIFVGRALYRAPRSHAALGERSERGHRRRGRRHPQSKPVVRAACVLRQDCARMAWTVAALAARSRARSP